MANVMLARIANKQCCSFCSVENIMKHLVLLFLVVLLSNVFILLTTAAPTETKLSSTLTSTKPLTLTLKAHHSNHRVHLHHNHRSDNNATTTNDNNNNSLRFKHKRCRYSDHEIEVLNNQNQLKKLSKNKEYQNTGNNYYDDETVASLNSYNYRNSHHVKQPKVRDQQFNNNRHNQHQQQTHESSGGNNLENEEFQAEHEKIYADIGDLINMTCFFNTEEVDWHFKDKNLTTTILAYGLELQVSKQIFLSADDQITKNLMKYEADYDVSRSNNNNQAAYRFVRDSEPFVFKYKVGSDRQFTHMLTMYVQGNQDEGIYQCIDSKSENPIKKTISLVLKNNSRALTSGCFAVNKSSTLLLYFYLFLLLNLTAK